MKNRVSKAFALLMLAGFAAGSALAQQGPPAGGPPRGGGMAMAPMYVVSKAFPDGGIVPSKYSMRGGSVQPDFQIFGAPDGTKSFAIILHDVDVGLRGPGDVLHWMAWNIPGDTTQIEEGKLPAGSVNGKNMMGRNAYMGMGAPPGPYHHYVFEFYALNSTLDLPPDATREQLLAAMQGKVIGKCAYVGRFRTENGPAAAK